MKHAAPRFISTPRLLLEPQCAAHALEMFPLLSDPALYRHEGEPPASLQALMRRFERLEQRHSDDGREVWLNWVLRLQGGPLIGVVQATLEADGSAAVAYELGSAHWGQGYGAEAVQAMMLSLVQVHGATGFWAVFKRSNLRSQHLLRRLGFSVPSPARQAERLVEADEAWMERDAQPFAASFRAGP